MSDSTYYLRCASITDHSTPCFAVPIFIKDNATYIQVTENGNIVGFDEVIIDDECTLSYAVPEIVAAPGDECVFSFFDPTPKQVVAGTKSEVADYLINNIESYAKRRFLCIDIYDFINDEDGFNLALSDAYQIFGKLNPRSALRWKNFMGCGMYKFARKDTNESSNTEQQPGKNDNKEKIENKKVNNATTSPTSNNYSSSAPKITVFGIGRAGSNAIRSMSKLNLTGIELAVADTDIQTLAPEGAEIRVQLGHNVTLGLGAGSRPEIGRAAAEESIQEIQSQLASSKLLFITAGMGGGTGSGAAPVIARAAREQGILTVGVVTKPFHFEGAHRMRMAEAAIEDLSQYVDTLIVISNQNLFRVATEKTTFADAFKMADDVLHWVVRTVTDLITMPGINLDVADIRTVMSEMGRTLIGCGEAEGDKRAVQAAEIAISNPLLDDISMAGARGVLINITGGMDMTLFEVDEAANRIRDEVSPEANIIFGSTFDEKFKGKMRVSVVATGIGVDARRASPERSEMKAENKKAEHTSNNSPSNDMKNDASHKGLFERLTPSPRAVERDTKRRSNSTDDLDIPAFLRRLAN